MNFRRALFMVSGWLFFSAPLAVAQMQIRPIPAVVEPVLPASTLTVRNTGVSPMAFQARVFAWNQKDGREILTATEEVALSPSIAEVSPGEEQVIRILRLSPPPQTNEQAFRIVLDEIPQAEDTERDGAINIRLQMVIPLILRTLDPVETGLACSVTDNLTTISCKNEGGMIAKLTRASVNHRYYEDVQPVASNLLGYVLPQSQMSWPLPKALPDAVNRIFRVSVNGHEHDILLEE